MKKIISLLATIAMMATMVTSVSAASLAANAAPVVDTVIEEITADSFETEWVGEPLEDGYKAYLVTANVSGLDLEIKCAGTTNVLKKKRTGVGLMYAGYEIKFDSTDNIGAVYTMDGIAGGSTVEKTVNALFAATKATEAYPTTTDGGAAATATDALVYQFVITVNGEVTGTPVAEFKVTEFTSDTPAATLNISENEADKPSYTVNGEAATTVTFGKEEGGEEPPVVPPVDDDETKAEVSDKIDLKENDVVIGAAWDVLIKNFDSAKSYMTTFTDVETQETRDDEAKAIDVSMYAETTGDVGFAVIMRLTAERNVALTIDVQ